MSKIKIATGTIQCTQANEDTRVVVNDAFSVLVPKGMMFSTDQEEIGEDKSLTMFTPISNLTEPADSNFYMRYSNAHTRIRFDANMHEFDSTVDLTDTETRKNLEETFVNALQRLNIQLGGLVGQGQANQSPFVVKSDEKSVVVANVQGFMGNAAFIFILPSGYYSGMYYVAKDAVSEQVTGNATPAIYKKTAAKLLSTIEAIEGSSSVSAEDGELSSLPVSELSYTQGRHVIVGSISVPIPDRTKYALSGTSDNNASVIPKSLRDNMDFICIPEVFSRGFRAYQDAPISIFFRKPTLVSDLEQTWNNKSVDSVVKQLIRQFEGCMNKQDMTKSLKIAHKEKGFMSCYCLFSGDNTEDDFWRSYAFYIVTGGIFVSGMFYFNQKASDSEFEAVVKNWLSEVRPICSDAVKKATVTLAQEQLGPYAADNGKPNALLVARLFAEDVLFFPETPFERKGNKLNLNPQFNIAKLGDHPFIMQNGKSFFSALGDLFIQLDANKELQVTKSQLHPKMLKPLLDNRLTGLSFLNLMAHHMVKIVEKDDEKNTYLVIVDQNVIAGIPNAYHYICKFIKFAREYNEKLGSFVVQFSSVVNFDSPISGKLRPVAGATVGQTIDGMCGFTVQEDGTITDGATITVDADKGSIAIQLGTRQPTQEEKMTNSELESKLDEYVVNAIKRYSKEALAAYKKIPNVLKAESFNGLQNTEDVIERLADKMVELSFTAGTLGFDGTFRVSYWVNSVQFEGGGFNSYDMFIPYEYGEAGDGSFNPNQIPNDLIFAAEQLTESEIYHSLLVSAVTAQNRGKVLIAPNSPKDVIRKLEQYDKVEVSGTQYEGRSTRIEHIKVGDTLELVREPDNVYDKNAIDIQNASGSLGHLPAHIVEQLSPLMDLGIVNCTATVSEVIPLSKRSSKAKKAILKVHLNYILVQEAEKQQSNETPKHKNPKCTPVVTEETKNTNAKEEKQREFEDRKAQRKAQDNRDATGKTFANNIRKDLQRLTNIYERRSELQGRILSHGNYSDLWTDPRLKADLANVDKIVNDYGNAVEVLIQDSLKKFAKMKSTLSAATAISIIQAIESAIDEVDNTVIHIEQLGREWTYHWKMDVYAVKSSLMSDKAELNELDTKQKAEQAKLDKEEAEYNEAKKYGISLDDLPAHRKYLAAKEKMSKAQTSREYTAAIASFNKIKGYKDSEELIEQCKVKVADKEVAEHHAKEVLQKWQLACDEVKTERMKLEKSMKESLCAEYDRKLEVLKQAQTNEWSEHSKKHNALTQKIKQLQEELKAAGLFDISKKKTLKSEIFEAQAAEANAERESSIMISRHNDEKKSLQDALSKALTTIPDKVEKELPLPVKTSDIIAAEKIFKAATRGKK